VNFNGTGTVAIRASGNVSSVTDNGVGNYTVNFTTAMPDANYAIVVTGQKVSNTTTFDSAGGSNGTTNASVRVINTGGTNEDATYLYAAIFR
jgi:hypothetical protein